MTVLDCQIRRFLISLCLLFQAIGLPTCRNINLQGYKFKLQSFKTRSAIPAISGNQIVRVSLCDLISCINNNIYENGYILLKKDDNNCIPYGSNLTGPLAQYYNLIDQSNPTKGISVKYVPTYRTQYQYQNKSITSSNQTIDYIQITETNSLYTSIININCPTPQTFNKQAYCNKTTISQSNMANFSYKIVNYENALVCQIYSSQGCPQLAVNSFWQFLINKSIIFAIVLWICGVFLLVLGYLAIRVTILLYGTFTGAFFGVIFIAENYINFYFQSNGIFIFTICLSIVLGLLFGIALLTLPKLGYVNIGIMVAGIFSLLLQNSVLFLTGSLLAFYITFGVTALIMSIIALLQLRYFIAICTSITGGFFLIRPLGFFLPGYPNQLISGKNFLISVRTPWPFYLYLGSILILTGIGIAIQYCVNKKVGSKGIGQYYLEDDGPIKDKLKKIFEFKQIKDMIKAGKKEILQLKNMITDQKNISYEQFGQNQEDHGHYIEMERMEKLQAKEKQKSGLRREKGQASNNQFKTPAKSDDQDENQSNERQLDFTDNLPSLRNSDEIPKKKNKKK